MPHTGRSNEEIVHALHQVERGEANVTEVCRDTGHRADGLWLEEAVQRPGPPGATRVPIPAPRKQQIEAGRGGPHAGSPHPRGDRPKMAVTPRTRSHQSARSNAGRNGRNVGRLT